MPWSTSSSAPCAPSNRTRRPSRGPGPAAARPAGRRAGSSARPLEQRRSELGAVDLGQAEAAAQRAGGGPAGARSWPRSAVAVGQVGDADRAAADLVLVGRADAAAGGADLGRSPACASRAASRSRCSGRIRQALSASTSRSGVIVTPWAPIALDLVQQGPGIDHHAVADDRQLALHHAGRQQATACRSCSPTTSVWPALWPPWKRTTTSARLRQPVDDLALALVAPLGADHGDVGQRKYLSGCGVALALGGAQVNRLACRARPATSSG